TYLALRASAHRGIRSAPRSLALAAMLTHGPTWLFAQALIAGFAPLLARWRSLRCSLMDLPGSSRKRSSRDSLRSSLAGARCDAHSWTYLALRASAHRGIRSAPRSLALAAMLTHGPTWLFAQALIAGFAPLLARWRSLRCSLMDLPGSSRKRS